LEAATGAEIDPRRAVVVLGTFPAIANGTELSPGNVFIVLPSPVDWALPQFASNDPSFIKRFDAARYFIKRTNIYFDLMLVAAKEARPANRTEAPSPIRGYAPGVFK
jgi:hypothetical protein